MRRTLAALIAMLVVGGLAVMRVPARATSTFAFQRFAGQNRYDTARLVAAGTFADNTTNAILATGENFPDALAGNYLAGDLSAPVLLTQPDRVPAETNAALVALGVKSVTLLGGTGAISAAVEQDLKSRGFTVARIQGDTRYDTALEVAAKPGKDNVGSVDGKRTALLASGENFPDALAGGPLSWKAQFPTLLTKPNELSPEARQAIQDLGIQQVLILGGTAAISGAVEDQVKAIGGVTTMRLQGGDRTQTATAVAEFALSKLAFSTTHVNLARGDAFPDALAGGPHGGKEGGVILLAASPTALDGASKANSTFLKARAATLANGHIYGGTGAISKSTEAAAATAAGALPPEAPAGQSTPTVAAVNLTESFFTSTADQTYFYDSNDDFQHKAANINRQQFEDLLNGDDMLTVTYDPNAAGKSTFNITNDVVHPTGTPAAIATNANGAAGAPANDVTVTVVIPTNNSKGTTYTLERASFTPPNCSVGVQGSFAAVPGANLSDGVHTDFDLADGCYVYRVTATSPAPSGLTATSPLSNRVTVPGPADQTPPTIRDVRAPTDAATAGTVDNGDVHRFTFDETMSTSTAGNGSTYRISDPDGTQADIVCGTTGSCALQPTLVQEGQNPPRQVSQLTVTLSAVPTAISPGTTPGLQYPVTILSVSSEWRDSNGNALTLTNSDVTIEKAS